MTSSSLPGFKPTHFARAVAALLSLDDMADEVRPRSVLLQDLAKPTWRVWMQVMDFRVEQGDRYYGNFEVKGVSPELTHARSILPAAANDERKVWAEGKELQLKVAFLKLEDGGQALLRWVAAIVDVMPKPALHGMLVYTRSLLGDEMELRTWGLTFYAKLDASSNNWDLSVFGHHHRLRKVKDLPVATVMVPVGYPEHLAIYKLLAPEQGFFGTVVAPEQLRPYLE